MKTTLCLTCLYGLVREYDCEDDNCKERHFNNKCLLGNDYVGVITMCNRCKKKETKVTYHDPDFDEYVNKIEEAEEDAKEDISAEKKSQYTKRRDYIKLHEVMKKLFNGRSPAEVSGTCPTCEYYPSWNCPESCSIIKGALLEKEHKK